MKVVILAGGLGSRLGELTRDLPKPMIPINGRPYLDYVVDSFAERGFREFVMLTGYRGDVIEQHFALSRLAIEFSREEKPLGTGGALLQARPLLGDRFLLTYGDVFRRFDYDRFVSEHPGNCLAVYPRRTHGNAEVTEGRVTRFDKRAPELPYLDAGFAVLENATLDLLLPPGGMAPPDDTGLISFEETAYPQLAERGELAAEIVGHDFYDIGTPEELARTREALERA